MDTLEPSSPVATAPPAPTLADGTRKSLDPQVVDLDRDVGIIVTACTSGGLLLATGILYLASDTPRWVLPAAPPCMGGRHGRARSGTRSAGRRIQYRHASYRVDPQGIEIARGVIWRSIIHVPVSRVQHTDVSQGPLQRRYGLGTLDDLHRGDRIRPRRSPRPARTRGPSPSATICCRGDPTMASERRLHPASFFFALGGHAKQLLLPGVFVLVSARSGRGNWETWAMVFIVPFAIAAAVRVLSYRYRFDEGELVVRTGFIFRNERHIPYRRIQNVDAVQNLLHRALGVADVRIETGGASEGEAVMRVVSLGAFRELRDRVFEGRTAIGADATAGAAGGSGVVQAPAEGGATARARRHKRSCTCRFAKLSCVD